MYRREFLKAAATATLVSATSLTAARSLAEAAQSSKPRVGLIGTGWYGKVDLLRLIQVAPVNVVSLCDVDRRMLAQAADLVAQRPPRGAANHTEWGAWGPYHS